MSNRVIKFRIWNGFEMVYDVMVGKFGVFYVNPSNYGLDPKDSASLTPFNTRYPDNTPVMQFTGLHDKQGVEIYDGDIVRILYTDWGSKLDSDTRTLDQYLKDIASIGVIEFNYDSYQVKLWGEKYKEHFYGEINTGKHGYIEVIGNIYQNPELLTK